MVAKKGFVVDPYDDEGWIAALRTLAQDHERRRAMAVKAAERAKAFHWDVVARRRRQQMLDRLTVLEPGAG